MQDLTDCTVGSTSNIREYLSLKLKTLGKESALIALIAE